MLGYRLDTVGYFRDQHDVGAAGNAGGDRDMTGIAAHHFEHHDAIMARRRRLQAVERLGRDCNRGVVADRCLGVAHIIVDRFRNRDERQPALLREPAENHEAPVTANTDQRVELQCAVGVDYFLRTILEAAIGHREGERVALIGRAENCAAEAHHCCVESRWIEQLGVGRLA